MPKVQNHASRRLILVKVAVVLDEILKLTGPCRFAGIVATHTTVTDHPPAIR
jgi:hypothetical protein